MKEWRGIPREQIPWFPSIDEEACIGCTLCVQFCSNEVLELDEATVKAHVANPYHCVVECKACAKLCPVNAISFPDEEEFAVFIKAKLAEKGT